MLQNLLAFLQGHGLAIAVAVFTCASFLLSGIAATFVALGKAAPAWIAPALTFVGNALHFLNGNAAPAVAALSADPAAK